MTTVDPFEQYARRRRTSFAGLAQVAVVVLPVAALFIVGIVTVIAQR